MTELEKCREWIGEALEYAHGTHTVADIIEGIGERKYQLWPTRKACLVTEILEYPQKKVCHVFLGAGDLEQILDMHESVIAWARQLGCSELTVSGRAGWQRALKNHNWKHAHTTLFKEI